MGAIRETPSRNAHRNSTAPTFTMTDDQLTVHSVTGVDLTLSIAGPGTRSYAFVIDWHIRLLLASAWLLAAYYVFGVTLKLKTQGALVSVLPAAIIYFLYHPILEVAMQGRTPGKRMAGVRILGRDGGPPSVTALLIRNIFRLIDSLPATYMIGLVTCFMTANRVRIGDMAAGTLLVLDSTAAEKSLARVEALAAGSQLPLDALELVDQVLQRWESLETGSRGQIARALLGRLEASAEPQALAALTTLSDPDLRAKLQAHLSSQDAAASHV
jgi:uncharacterized RDD family membrane protein YckC